MSVSLRLFGRCWWVQMRQLFFRCVKRLLMPQFRVFMWAINGLIFGIHGLFRISHIVSGSIRTRLCSIANLCWWVLVNLRVLIACVIIVTGGARILQMGIIIVFVLRINQSQSLSFIESEVLPLNMPFVTLSEARADVSDPCRTTFGKHLHVVGRLDHWVLVVQISWVPHL